MRDKEIRIYSFEDDETGICPFDGEACPRQRRCLGDVRPGYDSTDEILLIRTSLCARVPRTTFERFVRKGLQKRISDVREYMLKLSRRDMR